MFRAMLRGLLTHKLRLLLSSLAVILGTMFMSGAFIYRCVECCPWAGIVTHCNEKISIASWIK